ncbi:hypothetical protein D030_1449A, partial [Vibrio parahaemolyticus AQ3810]
MEWLDRLLYPLGFQEP